MTDVRAYDMAKDENGDDKGCFEYDVFDPSFDPNKCDDTWGGVLSIKEARQLTITGSEISETDAAISQILYSTSPTIEIFLE